MEEDCGKNVSILLILCKKYEQQKELLIVDSRKQTDLFIVKFQFFHVLKKMGCLIIHKLVTYVICVHKWSLFLFQISGFN